MGRLATRWEDPIQQVCTTCALSFACWRDLAQDHTSTQHGTRPVCPGEDGCLLTAPRRLIPPEVVDFPSQVVLSFCVLLACLGDAVSSVFAASTLTSDPANGGANRLPRRLSATWFGQCFPAHLVQAHLASLPCQGFSFRWGASFLRDGGSP